ncbi:gamma carbonic anhydrase family protein [Elusimicrobiota bacterium]
MIKNYGNFRPRVDATAYVAQEACLIGNVRLEKNTSIWPGAVLRGDVDMIVVKENTNIQDGTLIHTNYMLPSVIGRNVTVGHGAIIHGSKIADFCLIGMGGDSS